MYGGKVISNKCFQFVFTKAGYSLKIFNCNRELISDCRRIYRESTFANIGFSFRNKMLFGNG